MVKKSLLNSLHCFALASDFGRFGRRAAFEQSQPLKDQTPVVSRPINRSRKKTSRPRFHILVVIGFLAFSSLLATNAFSAEDNKNPGMGDKLTAFFNLDVGYRKSQFFAPQYDTALLQWDGRVEAWLPPFRDKLAWGPYLHLAVVKGSQNDAFQNAWLGGPGVGLQFYPLSIRRFQGSNSQSWRFLGPLRLFAEYNFTDYWGKANSWRPRSQRSTGIDYWNTINVNELSHLWWTEIWTAFSWQSSNESTDRYDSPVLTNSVRLGIRKPRAGASSTITPYFSVDNSRTKYHQAWSNGCVFAQSGDLQNPCDFYWENRLLVGAGLRFAPSLGNFAHSGGTRLGRFVIYGEYLRIAKYYGPSAPSAIPRFDIRIGVSTTIGLRFGSKLQPKSMIAREGTSGG